ncbi:hypothetical protein CAPTEDRAFT_186976 [Capitella teleta]|uniref:SH3 domain-containing protein n=1 Tax=Capitella teleta TaxID=283909 RepID=R7VI67_CAPTE|nr:hypothetical protein CAPTEDRAFT_186976 [Capitella teleta]|eukprot:ELU18543.1 hypothetical protein CAPTEDRAFT_186976 [Capitella teleta]
MATGRAGTHIRLLYDFEYQSPDGCQVKFAAGEECLLLKKTNPEWWYVLKKKEKRPLYVPANYVEQVETSEKPKKRAPPVPPPKPKLPKPSMEEEVLRELDSIINHALDEEIPVGDEDDDTPFYDKVTGGKSVDKPSTPEPDYEQGRSEDSSPSVPPLHIGMRAGSETSGYKTDSRESLDSPIPPNGADMYEAPQYANLASLNAEVQADSLSPTDDQPNYANLSDVQHSIHSGSLPESAVKREASDPGTSSADTVSLRKPVQVNSFGTPVFLTSDVSAEEETRIPEGWKEQKLQDGDVTYTHDHSDEKVFFGVLGFQSLKIYQHQCSSLHLTSGNFMDVLERHLINLESNILKTFVEGD